MSFEPPYEEDERGYSNDPIAELRYEPVWSTRDVAAYCSVSTATVRQWVARGHLEPCGTRGPSHVFERNVVLAAVPEIAVRTRRAGQATEKSRSAVRGRPRPTDTADADATGLDARALDRLAKVTPNTRLTVAEAATLLGLKPSTIRSWVYRGHLAPVDGSKPRQPQFRLAELYRAARRT